MDSTQNLLMQPQTELPNLEKALLSKTDKVDELLASVGLNNLPAGIERKTLEDLIQLEQGYRAFLRWAVLDSVFEHALQYPFLRQWPRGRSTLLDDRQQIGAVYALRGFKKGAELILFKFVQIAIYSVIAYGFINLMSNSEHLKNIIQSMWRLLSQADKRGSASIAYALGQIEPQILREGLLYSALASPLVYASYRSFRGRFLENKFVTEQRLTQWTDACMMNSTNPLINFFSWFLYYIPKRNPTSRLQLALNWDQNFSTNQRKRAIQALINLAQQGSSFAQADAMHALAKITHGISFHAFCDLQTQYNNQDQLREVLLAKVMALQTLRDLSHYYHEYQQKPQQAWRLDQRLKPLVRWLYANYLCWWVGGTRSLSVNSAFFIYKIGKLILTLLFLTTVIRSVIEQINCPNTPGFEIGQGRASWAGKKTTACFEEKLRQFRLLDQSEPIENLIGDLDEYYLDGLNAIDVINKNLTNFEAWQLLKKIKSHSETALLSLTLVSSQIDSLGNFPILPQLTYLDLQDNQLSSLTDFPKLLQLVNLDLRSNSLRSLTGLPSLPRLTTLTLMSNLLNSLTDFPSLPDLTHLELKGNQLSNLVGLTSLPQLTYLGLEGNLLSSLTGFPSLPQLMDLRLWANQLSNLTNFPNLPQLIDLDLGNNKLRNLASFPNLSQLTWLSLWSNKLNSLADFPHLPQLLDLDLGDNQLSSLTGLPNLPKLNHLGLAYNLFSNLADFPNLFQLQWLDLANNKFRNLVNFPSLSQLIFLDLGNNQLSSLASLPNLPKLLILGLANNSQLSSLTDFPSLPQLASLDLAGNQISSLTGIPSLPQLVNLYLGNNQLSSLADCPNLPKLKSLNVWDNKLSNLTNFPNLPELTSLNLSYNQLSIIMNFPSLPNLLSLQLQHNQIVSLVDFPNLSQLTFLSLNFNLLNSINGFPNLPLLKNLDLSNNQLNSLSGLPNLPKLNSLRLSVNQLSNISNFPDLPLLGELNLLGNQLSNLSNFPNQPQLISLDLSSNRLDSLSDFPSLSQLIQLDLSNNQLSSLSNFPTLPKLNLLNLSRNHLDSDGLQPLLDYLTCMQLYSLDLNDNKFSQADLENLNSAVQQNALRQYCEDNRCHANLPDRNQHCRQFETSDAAALQTPAPIRLSVQAIKAIGEGSQVTWSWLMMSAQVVQEQMTGAANSMLDSFSYFAMSYIRKVVSECPSYFDPNATQKLANQQSIDSRWSGNSSLFGNRVTDHSAVLSCSTQANISAIYSVHN